MKILSFVAENFKKIRVVEITPKGRVTTVSGRNGQGKTSLLDALWAMFAGRKGIPDKPVRKSTERSKLTAVLSDEDGRPFLRATRTIAIDRTTSLTIEGVAGAQRPAGTPQAVLDALIGEMTFDPGAFVRLDAKKQAETLRGLVKLDVDLDDLANANLLDYAERTIVNRKADELRTQAKAVVVSPGLPKERADEEAIKERRRAAQMANAKVGETIQHKLKLERTFREAEGNARRHAALTVEKQALIEELEQATPEIEAHKTWLDEVEEMVRSVLASSPRTDDLPIQQLLAKLVDVRERTREYGGKLRQESEQREVDLEQARLGLAAALETRQGVEDAVTAAQTAWELAPDGTMLDVRALDEELEQAQLVNREIGKRERRDELEAQVLAAERESERLSGLMRAREAQKTEALASAKMPVEGLTFDENGVWFKGIPLEQLAHSEKIRVGCALAIAAVEEKQRKDKAGKLRCIPIDDAESLDDESLGILAAMAEEHDFQLILFKVDASGKCGIVLEDGMVVGVNE